MKLWGRELIARGAQVHLANWIPRASHFLSRPLMDSKSMKFRRRHHPCPQPIKAIKQLGFTWAWHMSALKLPAASSRQFLLALVGYPTAPPGLRCHLKVRWCLHNKRNAGRAKTNFSFARCHENWRAQPSRTRFAKKAAGR